MSTASSAVYAARLVGKNGEYAGGEFVIKGDDFTIGRAFECHLMLNDNMISGRHSRIVRQGEHYQLEDLGSTNGTFVNGEKIDKKILRTGDKVMIGGLEFEFLQPLDVSRTMVATPEAMAEIAKAKTAAAAPAAPAPTRMPTGAYAAPAAEVVRIPPAKGGGKHPLAGLIPAALMGLIIAYLLPLLSAAFQMNKTGALSVSNLVGFVKNWGRIFPGVHTHVGVQTFGLNSVTGWIVLAGLVLGPLVGGFLTRRVGAGPALGSAVAFTVLYVVLGLAVQIGLLKASFGALGGSYPGLVPSLGVWGNLAVGVLYFAGVVFVLSFLGALMGKARR